MSAVTYNTVVRDNSQVASSGVVGRLLLPDLTQVPPSWKIEFRGKVLERSTNLNDLMCFPQDPIQIWKPTNAQSAIFLSTLSNQTIELPFVSPDTTLDVVKDKVFLITGLHHSHQRLLFAGESLEQDNRTLKDYGIKYGDTIQLVLWVQRGFGPQNDYQPTLGSFEIYVRMLTGKIITLEVSSEDSLDILKGKFYEREGILPDQQIRWIWSGHQLDTGAPLKNYGVRNDDTLHVHINLRGGVGRLPEYRPDDHTWSAYYYGLNLLGVCSKPECISNLRPERIIIMEKYGELKMIPGEDPLPCPACPDSVNYEPGRRGVFCPQNFLVSAARSLFRFKKAGYDQPVKAFLVESFEVYDEDNFSYKMFDAREWDKENELVEITTVKVDKSPYFCVICDTACISPESETMRNEKILSCGHAYHRKCAPGEGEECVVCRAKLFENMEQLLGDEEGEEGKKMATGRKRKVEDDDHRSEAEYGKTSRAENR